jgi:hypothetical protein
MTYKGVVKNNVVILEEGSHLPDGTRVTVMAEELVQEEEREETPEEREERRALVARMKEFGQRLAERRINLGNLILEEREELEDRA